LAPSTPYSNLQPRYLRVCLNKLLLLQDFNAASGHLDEGSHTTLGAKRGLDSSQKVVGLEDEDHLPVDESQHISDFLEVFGCIRFDLGTLSGGPLSNIDSLLYRTPRTPSHHAGKQAIEHPNP